jgi:hypothetical protein
MSGTNPFHGVGLLERLVSEVHGKERKKGDTYRGDLVEVKDVTKSLGVFLVILQRMNLDVVDCTSHIPAAGKAREQGKLPNDTLHGQCKD